MMIIAILLYLILPAVVGCAGSGAAGAMRQQPDAAGHRDGHLCVDPFGLPPGVVNDSGPIKNLPSGYHHGWVVQILPFIGQVNTYNHFDLRESVYDVANDTVAATSISSLICPSSDATFGRMNNYAGCHDDDDAAIDSDNRGVLYLNSQVRYDEITDGPAYTILLGEILNEGPTLGWVSGTRSTLRNTGPPIERRPTAFATLAKIRAGTDRRPDARSDVRRRLSRSPQLAHGRSTHRRILELSSRRCNFLFCDGSVRPVQQSIDTRVYRLLGNRADGEPISSDSY